MDAHRPAMLITGATGMLGAELARQARAVFACTGLHRRDVLDLGIAWHQADISHAAALKTAVQQIRPDVIVHCAALTNVDQCEKEPSLARAVHVDATSVFADYAEAARARLVYISTDAVFPGAPGRPYRETDQPEPLNAYGRSKLEGEKAALASASSLVLRTNIFGWRPKLANSFGEWVLDGLRRGARLTMFRDVLFTPIYTGELARLMLKAIGQDLSGLYHAGGAEALSKHAFALRVAQAYGLSGEGVEAISVDDKAMGAPRSKNMALDSGKFAARLHEDLPDVDKSIAAWRGAESVEKGRNLD